MGRFDKAGWALTEVCLSKPVRGDTPKKRRSGLGVHLAPVAAHSLCINRVLTRCHRPPIWYHRSAKPPLLPSFTPVHLSHAMSHRIEPTDTTAQAGASGNEPENTGPEGIVTETSSAEGSSAEDADAGLGQPITLNDFIKTSGLVGTGGQAKLLIQAGDVVVNGEVETRRRRKLWPGDTVSLLGQTAVVTAGGEPR